MKHAIIFGLAGVLLSSAALANSFPHKGLPEARIPFGGSSIDTWQPDGDRALYIKGPGRQWYHAELVGYCRDLTFDTAIGFETRGTGDFDGFSSLIVGRQRCPLASLVKSPPPPKKAKKAKKG